MSPGSLHPGRIAAAALLSAVVLLAGGAGSAAAVPAATPIQTIADGGFEDTVCDASDPLRPICSNPHWEQSGLQNIICTTSVCGAGAPANGDGLLALGGQMFANDVEVGSVSQDVDLPSSGPRTLSFELAGRDGPSGAGFLAVEVDGLTYLNIAAADAPADYEQRTLDLSGFSGPHTISFEVACSRLFPPGPLHPSCDSFRVDDVSLPAGGVLPSVRFLSGPKPVSERRRVRFAFAAFGLDAAGFRCRLDRGDPFDCASPLHLRTRPGRHRLRVRGLTAGGERTQPAEWSWRRLAAG